MVEVKHSAKAFCFDDGSCCAASTFIGNRDGVIVETLMIAF